MGFHFKKRSSFIKINLVTILFILIIFITGCGRQASSSIKNNNINTNNNSNTINSALNDIKIDDKKIDVLAVILNNPSKDKTNKIAELETFEFDKTSKESILIIPMYNNMSIEIKELILKNDNLEDGKTLYKAENTKDGFGLLVKAFRPCGMPALKIHIKDNDTNGEYILEYNGKDGTPDTEYILRKNS